MIQVQHYRLAVASFALSFLLHPLAGANTVPGTSTVAISCNTDCDDRISYLQYHTNVRSYGPSPVQPSVKSSADEVPLASVHLQIARLQASRPAAFVHVPKCGTSFVNALLHLPGMCPYMSEDFVAEDKGAEIRITARRLVEKIDLWCPGSFAAEGRADFMDHSGLGGIYKSSVEGHGFVMLRQPEQRLISAYFYGQHSWPLWYFGRWAKDLSEYAHVMSGCAVRMFTRKGDGGSGEDPMMPTVCGDPEPATAAEVKLAKQRLASGFVFVGLTDEWDLSICLLHNIFGGACLASDFANMRPGDNSSDALYDTSELKGYKDLADGALFDEASAMFSQQLQRYGVNYQSCQPCFQQAASLK